METVGPAASRHLAASELVDDHDLPVLDDVVDVAPEERVGAESLLDVVEGGHVARIVEVVDVQQPLAAGNALLGQRHRPCLLVDDEVPLHLGLDLRELPLDDRGRATQLRDDPIDLEVEVGRLVGGPGDDQRCPRLVDQDRVHLVDDRVVQLALHQLLERETHVVAKVIEAELVVGPVGDVGPVGFLARARPQRRQADVRCHVRRVVQKRRLVLDHADGESERLVDGAHPLRVAFGQIVVDGDDVDAPPGQRVQIRRQRRHERLALAGRHLGDCSGVEHHATDQLDVEVPHADRAARRLTADGERLTQDLVDGLTPGEPLPELVGLRAEPRFVERLQRRFESVDGDDGRHHPLDVALVLGAEDLLQQSVDHDEVIIQGAIAEPANPGARARGRARCR